MRFYLDYIVYESLPGASVDGEMLVIGSENFDASRDPHLTFSPGWVLSDAWESNAMLTRTPGSNVTVSFNGTEIQLYGDLNSTESSNRATYQVDDASPQSFQLFRGTPAGASFTNQMLFNISQLSPDTEHTIVVTLTGTHESMSLTVDYFLVRSLTGEEQASRTSQDPIQTSPSAAQPNRTAAVIGGTVGGVSAILIVAIALLLWIKRKRNQKQV
ncbi:hypothetical protein VKT23_019705 [Stygiomarasmius scandens]|uniref:Uncharacterized protein n=1 Tax=Marasmiellus scandens TaxID=2682957 RepID=A0ABR1IKQ0_9AGAR